MNSFELNKIMGAILGTLLFVVAMNIAAGAVFAPVKPDKPGYEIAVPDKPKGGEQKPEETPTGPPIEQLLASADTGRGKNAAAKCAACHTFEKDGRALVGPNLWGVIGRPKASVQGFNYTPAFKQMTGNWTVQDLNQFLMNPKGMVPGTAMVFQGVPRGGERADLIAYLNSLSDNPSPLPRAAEAPGGQQTR